MHLFKTLTFAILVAILATSCSNNNYKFKLNTTNKITFGDNASISFEQIKGKPIDSVHLFIENKKIDFNGKSIDINSKELGIGKHNVVSVAFYPNGAKKTKNYIEVLANKTPIVYQYKIIKVYPHNKNAYTQGLEYHNGFLYETTGRKGHSSLRKIELETGKILQEKKLDDIYFGEGMTIFNDKVFYLTWKAGKGFIYKLNDFDQIGEFKYNNSIEGWGLTHNATELIKSDGTNKIWFLNPENQQEKRFIQVYTNKYAVDKLNELEYVNGMIYANKWQQNSIVIINPENGIVEGVANLNGLKKIIEKTQKLDPLDDVLNGIAYDKENNRLFVTGKHWDKLFEIELITE